MITYPQCMGMTMQNFCLKRYLIQRIKLIVPPFRNQHIDLIFLSIKGYYITKSRRSWLSIFLKSNPMVCSYTRMQLIIIL